MPPTWILACLARVVIVDILKHSSLLTFPDGDGLGVLAVVSFGVRFVSTFGPRVMPTLVALLFVDTFPQAAMLIFPLFQKQLSTRKGTTASSHVLCISCTP